MKTKKDKKAKVKGTFWKDFKAFIARGNIVDLAVAVVVGAAFTAIVNSFVADIIKPLLALLVGNDFSELLVVLRAEELDPATGEVLREAITLNYGNLIMAILTFLIDALVIFIALRYARKAKTRILAEAEKLKVRREAENGGQETAAASDAAAAESVPAAAVTPAQTPAESADAAVSAVPSAALSADAVRLLEEIRDLLKAERSRADAAPEPKE